MQQDNYLAARLIGTILRGSALSRRTFPLGDNSLFSSIEELDQVSVGKHKATFRE
jgi:hypothetical protein